MEITKCSFISLPTDLLLIITSSLPEEDADCLRLTCHHFYTFLPPPTHAQLCLHEGSISEKLSVCAGCTRLRPKFKFDPEMIRGNRLRLAGSGNRFWVECGERPPPGQHRYHRGASWEFERRYRMRCGTCTKVRDVWNSWNGNCAWRLEKQGG